MKFVVETCSAKIPCSELTIKHYKEILKCCFGDEPDYYILCETLCSVFSELTNLPISHFYDISLLDLLLFCIQLKVNSQGEILDLIVTKDDKQMNLELNLIYVWKRLKDVFGKYNAKQFQIKDLTIDFEIPSIKRFLNKDTETKEDFLLFIKTFRKGDKCYCLQNDIEAKQLFDELPPAMSLEIIDMFSCLLRASDETNFFDKYKIKDQKLSYSPTLDFFIKFMKLLFHEPLDVFYDNLFCLAHYGKIDLNYVSTLTPGEYIYILKRLEQTLSSNSKTNKTDVIGSPEEIDDGQL